jgi:three-Cys-motif partner protein
MRTARSRTSSGYLFVVPISSILSKVGASGKPGAIHHFAFLDPFNLGALSFDIIRKLATLPHVDILIHVSAQDLNRNLRKYIAKHGSSLDAFAPGWRDNVDTGRADGYVRFKIFNYWRELLRSVGLPVAEAAELVSGEGNQPLYWLAFAARNKLAHAFWDKIRTGRDDRQQSLLGS